MSLPRIAIQRPVFTWMLMAALIIFGLIAFFRLGISKLPDVDFPVIGVSLSLPGAAPEVVETQVIDPIEDSIMQIDGIRSITSSSQQSSGSVSVEFELGRDIDQALQEVRNRIDQVRNILPAGLFPPRLRKTNPEDQPILWLGLTTSDPQMPLMDLMIYAKDHLQNQFGTVPGVGNIVVGGYVDPSLRVWPDVKKMNHWDITAGDIVAAIQSEQIEIPAGQIGNDRQEYAVRVLGESHTAQDFGQIRLTHRTSLGANFKPLMLQDVADIEEGTADVRKISRMNGKLAVGLGIVKQPGSNAVEVADDIRKKLEEIRPSMPKSLSVDVRSDNTRFIKQSVHQLLFTLLMSAILTAIVCYFFLGSWSSTLNVLMSIPTSVIGTFIVFYAFNFTLNTFTLLGLSLAIGIVVDDAIMMLENIVRHRELGRSQREAALRGAEEISFAAVAATFAVVAIFIPVIYMKGIIGRYFLQYGITVAAAVLLSLLEALTLTPMRCSRYLKLDSAPTGVAYWADLGFKKLAQKYEFTLGILLAHRWKTIALSFILFLGSLYIGKHLPSEMMPPQDQSMFMLRFKLPVGTALNVTDQKIKQVEEYLLKVPEIKGLYSVVGGFGGDAVNQGMAYATLVDPSLRTLSQAELIKKVRKELKHRVPGMEINVQDLSLRGFTATRGFPVEFIVQGPNWEVLSQVTQKIMEKMKEALRVVDVNTDVQKRMDEIQIIPDREALARYAVNVSEVTQTINTLMGGQILNGQTEYPKDHHRYQIEIRLRAPDREKIPDLSHVMIRNTRGQRISLSKLVKVQVRPSQVLISRLNRARAITVYGNPGPGYSQQEAMEYTEKLAQSMLPPGYSLKMVGSSQGFRESFQSLMAALVLGIIVSYMILGSQFNSFIHPITVLTALPFSLSGAFIGLAVCGQSINMYSLIGFILLMGIVKKNSILLVDFTHQCRLDLKDVHQSLLKACPIRLRPILMTSIATIAGALPEALSIGPGSEAMIPMAISIIGGVIASTILTLFVVPCVYSLISKLEKPDSLNSEII